LWHIVEGLDHADSLFWDIGMVVEMGLSLLTLGVLESNIGQALTPAGDLAQCLTSAE